MVSFRISVVLSIFFLEDLPINVSGVLKSIIIVFWSISPFMSVSICFMYLSAPILDAYLLTRVTPLLVLTLYWCLSLSLFMDFVLKSTFSVTIIVILLSCHKILNYGNLFL